MQDSIEDYIKLSTNVKPDEPVKTNKDVQITAQRKKECDMRAMKIVEFSIEGKLRPEIFTRCLPFIDQSHYQDIVEERAITKLCGYSLCGKRIPDMPKKRYYISTKSNKVYDITDRKNYCSNFCYKASLHIKNQIDNSPLWLRKFEDIPEYQLMESTEGGLPGECIDQGIVKALVEPAFASISMFTEVSLRDIVDKEKGKEKLSRGTSYRKSSKLLKSTMQTIAENSEQVEEEETIAEKPLSLNKNNSKCNIKKFEHSNSLSTLPVIDENEEKFEKTELDENIRKNVEPVKSFSKKSKKKGTKSQKMDIEFLINKALKEWLTLESFIFIHGETKVKEILNEKKLSDYFEELNITELQRDQQLKYMNICKRLQLQEMADEKFDNVVVGNTKIKPVPDYKKLKDENKDLDLKVKCFYSGVLHEREDTNFPTAINKKSDVGDEGGPPAVLPLVDVNSQNAMRRKIFLTSINKSMHQLLQALNVANFSAILSDLQTLVRTFNLKADNIVFKPTIWNFITIALLNILSIRDKNIKNMLEEKQNQRYIELQLNSLPSKAKFICEISAMIQNIDLFVETYISSK
ncbi:RNA polymerase II subunit B1 CTD phosphatase Rpap2 [Anoplophora glabripennis]|uniref:RNA polymerase II subunit B1 CTD phosphatase Rpap2 n=1 Tax=Anoplophora glabripennis TaxID=217634 RepID=UPI0008739B4B|nr:RNA polymerase II subunit B1 CTD phosphatase Rpap2 [Anoplophora glabripennis]